MRQRAEAHTKDNAIEVLRDGKRFGFDLASLPMRLKIGGLKSFASFKLTVVGFIRPASHAVSFDQRLVGFCR